MLKRTLNNIHTLYDYTVIFKTLRSNNTGSTSPKVLTLVDNSYRSRCEADACEGFSHLLRACFKKPASKYNLPFSNEKQNQLISCIG